MSDLWHVKSGLAGYGPEPDEESGYPTADNMTGLCELIVSELADFVQMASDAAYGYNKKAKEYREDGNVEGELETLREYVTETERAEELDNLRANCEPDRGKGMPAYADDAAWEEARRAFIESEFPGGCRYVAENIRLYVWVCDQPECESCADHLADEE